MFDVKSLKTIKLNDKLTTTDNNAFNLCSSLTTISSPDSITK
ncbi:leucine-rich repeat protein [Brachyspira sp.]